MTTYLRITGVILASIMIIITMFVWIVLVRPGTPGQSPVMKFEGFIDLPKEGQLSVLDYIDLEGDSLFVTSVSSGSLFKVSLVGGGQPASRAIGRLSGGGSVHGVALLPGKDLGFVTRSGQNTVDIFRPSTMQRLGRIPVADGPDAILYDSISGLVYVGNADANLATLIDPRKGKVVGTIHIPGSPEDAAVDSRTGILYQNLQDTNEVAAVDLVHRAVLQRWPLTSCVRPTGIAIDSEQRRLYIACSGNAKMVVFDLDHHQIISNLKIGKFADSVATDATLHRIYVASTFGDLTVIKQAGPDQYKVLDKIRTHVLAHTLSVDPRSHKVYVGYGSLFVQPRIAVFSPIL